MVEYMNSFVKTSLKNNIDYKDMTKLRARLFLINWKDLIIIPLYFAPSNTVKWFQNSKFLFHIHQLKTT